ncbi:hypothetical protein P4O66_002014 [Electrophorus voltai]|uniref:Uncharacterized protein n=1 Tax=Electrophorus voltai TaxID=2609070 RepID=A0AAD8ZVR2_9TELE|nr:hypothetical protein P4O66_002014 [Electrophorus voltai]
MPPVLRALEEGEAAGEGGSALGQDYTERVMSLLGMGHRLFVPRLLATSKEDLLQADFEGALKFFRVQLPKRYRAAENARRLMEQACNIKALGPWNMMERKGHLGSDGSVSVSGLLSECEPCVSGTRKRISLVQKEERNKGVVYVCSLEGFAATREP